MPTSAERLRPLPYDHPVAQHLVERVQQEYVVRYGGRDAAVVDPAEFTPPAGLFLVAEVDGVPAGCGAWRVLPSGEVEIKRVYVEPAHRRRGLAQRLMAALEDSAARAGHRAVVLNTGQQQPEALALYARLGYQPVPGYGVYACAPDAVFLGRELAPRGGPDGIEGGKGISWAS
ncbi:GNAT family N-acetyltransferase [Blastococcus sp. TML/M2B]|uniref:GNAT family N-acetyltransferase n=1 Tax=unclassified Blastococcus TaxID=2619396 RepID=UPI00190BFE1A|nr:MULTISPECIES: GNAT family N-acetyltransferase [unclassified Blastococcus]MBN1093577.1 GNAT family N-acetyltransferase [Blastococcus sp. TML/M2B]MBN1096306.1 GNAT family N-acetyltransferase [Blastococcus sp. TML/C7B]